MKRYNYRLLWVVIVACLFSMIRPVSVMAAPLDWDLICEKGFDTNKNMAVHFLLMKDGYLHAGTANTWGMGSTVWRTWIGVANGPPVASNDVASTQEDTPIVINVLANDTDPNSDSLTISNVTQGANGAVVINGGDTNVTYTPDVDWSGTDTFTYAVSDWYGGFDTGTVDVTVTPVNDAPAVVLVTPTNGSVLWVGCTISLTASPSDVDGTITQVVFFADGIQIGQATSLPWQDSSALTDTGQYSMTARAWDDSAAGGTSTSASVTVPFDYDSDLIADTWEYKYGLSPTNAADTLDDDDGDMFINRDEHTADTDPHNSNSYFRLTGADHTNSCTVTFVCTNSRVYGRL